MGLSGGLCGDPAGVYASAQERAQTAGHGAVSTPTCQELRGTLHSQSYRPRQVRAKHIWLRTSSCGSKCCSYTAAYCRRSCCPWHLPSPGGSAANIGVRSVLITEPCSLTSSELRACRGVTFQGHRSELRLCRTPGRGLCSSPANLICAAHDPVLASLEALLRMPGLSKGLVMFADISLGIHAFIGRHSKG